MQSKVKTPRMPAPSHVSPATLVMTRNEPTSCVAIMVAAHRRGDDRSRALHLRDDRSEVEQAEDAGVYRHLALVLVNVERHAQSAAISSSHVACYHWVGSTAGVGCRSRKFSPAGFAW